MLGDTLTVTVGGSGGTARTLSKINQDAYSAEYLWKGSSEQLQVLVRHNKETPKGGAQIDRHNVTFNEFVYPTTEKPLGVTRQVSFTLRNDPTDAEGSVTDLGEALSYWMSSSNLAKLFGWES